MEKRPEWNKELFLKLCDEVALDLQKWNKEEYTLEEYKELCRSVLKYNLREDGFQLAKLFEEEGLESNSELVSILDSVSYIPHKYLKEEYCMWVVKNNLSLKYSLGDIVKHTSPRTKIEESYEIVSLYPEALKYGIWNNTLGYEKTKGHRVVLEETLKPVKNEIIRNL